MDTRSKRASAVGVVLATIVVLPAPDGTIAQADRQHVAACYSGVSAGVSVVYEVVALTSVSITAGTLANVTLTGSSGE